MISQISAMEQKMFSSTAQFQIILQTWLHMQTWIEAAPLSSVQLSRSVVSDSSRPHES